MKTFKAKHRVSAKSRNTLKSRKTDLVYFKIQPFRQLHQLENNIKIAVSADNIKEETKYFKSWGFLL